MISSSGLTIFFYSSQYSFCLLTLLSKLTLSSELLYGDEKVAEEKSRRSAVFMSPEHLMGTAEYGTADVGETA